MNQLENKMRKYARLAVRIGVNIQKGQMLLVRSNLESKEFTRMVIEEAYLAGAGYVMVDYRDNYISRLHYEYGSDKYMLDLPKWEVDRLKYLLKENAALLTISSPNPKALEGVDPKRIDQVLQATDSKTEFYYKEMMNSSFQWSIVTWPNEIWAKMVYPDLETEVAVEKLLDAIFEAVRISDDNDVVADWKKHLDLLVNRCQIMNNYNFKSLHFKNSLGTDLFVDLVKNHIWAGGDELAQNNVLFLANIPTEEIFTMPDRNGVNGKVVSTKPLNYRGVLIEDFYLVFKDGKVVEYDAKKSKEALDLLINFDKGSSRLGEVALISHNSPISNLNAIFYNTLFDENASCHLALGNAYSLNLKDGQKMSNEELLKHGCNISLVHEDFMFGSKDLEVDGHMEDGTIIPIFRKGNFII